MSTLLLNILSKAISSAYVTLIPYHSSLKVSEKIKTSGVFNLYFELKIQKQDLLFTFSKVF